jgi:putative hemolysin
MTGIAGALIALLLVSSAILTAAQEAASQIGASRLRTLSDEGFRGAEALAKVHEKADTLRGPVRLITGVFNLTALGAAAAVAVTLWGTAGAVLGVVGVGILTVIVVTDVIPHAVAARSPVRLALSSAPTLLRVARWTQPLTVPVKRLEDRLTGGNDDERASEHRELLEIQELGEEEGVLEAAENRLVERAFRLDELAAWDVMVPRVDIFAWKEELRLSDIVDELPEVPFSRVPVFRGSVDEVTGILYIREIYERITRGEQEATLSSLARPPFFVPGSLSCTQLLQDFQSKRIHMGIVADEFGGTDGLVTLEDVLEELVGEIRDETDIEEEEVVRLSEDMLECDAGVDVRELNEALDVLLPKAEHRSLNGFILEELGHVPDSGTYFEREGVRIDILEATETQVLRARLTKLQNTGEPTE